MPHFMRRSTIVEAHQFRDGTYCPGVHGWAEGERHSIGCYPEDNYEIKGPAVVTINRQVVRVKTGDWIVKESDDIHYYPIEDSEFQRLYTLAESQ
jgi:hypothetical protein